MSETCACGARRVDVHAHFLPECYRDALARSGLSHLDGGMPIPAWSAGAALAMMDRQEIETALISLSSPSTHFLTVAEKPALCRAVNEAGRALVTAHPTRFGFLASLPLPDLDAALREVEFALNKLAVDGFVLETNINGIYLGSPHFAPLFAELNARGATVFLHPTSPACLDALALGRPAPLIEFPLDTTRAIVDLLYQRVIQSNPNIKFIVPHAGAALPALAARIALFANVPFIEPRPASEQEVFEALAGLYYDTAVTAHPSVLAALRRLTPLDHILFGSDFPFTPEIGVARGIWQLLNENGLAENEIAQITRGNAERLFPRLKAITERA
ncbi:MAG: amidohydrolase family protein [Hyphomonadaceae bacterium]